MNPAAWQCDLYVWAYVWVASLFVHNRVIATVWSLHQKSLLCIQPSVEWLLMEQRYITFQRGNKKNISLNKGCISLLCHVRFKKMVTYRDQLTWLETLPQTHTSPVPLSIFCCLSCRFGGWDLLKKKRFLNWLSHNSPRISFVLKHKHHPAGS